MMTGALGGAGRRMGERMKERLIAVFLLCVAAALMPSIAAAQASRDSLIASGVNLEKQWGFGVVYYNQTQPYKIDNLVVGLPGFDPALAQGLNVDSKATTYHAVLDYWALPFLNFEIEAGKISGSTDVGLSSLNIGIPLSDITVDYDGFFYGGGFTLAAGGKSWFTTLTTQYENTKLHQENSTVTAWVFTPRIGTNVGRYSSVYVGGMYQRPDEKHKGVYTIPGLGTVPYDVTLAAKYQWNYLAGAVLGLTENWRLNLDWGFGDRHSLQAYLSYRW
jgi:hypothetical protein